MMNATVYFDSKSDPRNPGWVCQTDDDTRSTYQLDATDPDADDATLIAEAWAFSDGQITVRR
jgi:hypothetical protein